MGVALSFSPPFCAWVRFRAPQVKSLRKNRYDLYSTMCPSGAEPCRERVHKSGDRERKDYRTPLLVPRGSFNEHVV